MQPDFTNEFETTKLQQHAGKLNGFGANTNNFRASFTGLPNTNRPHPSSFRETHNFMQPDVYPPPMTSPMGSYDSHSSFDYGHSQPGLGGPKVFIGDYNANAASMLSHHNNPKANGPMAQQPSHSKYSNPHAFSGGVQLTSQTPYGPHIPAGAMGNSSTASAPAPVPAASSNTQSAANNQEEICTIFVVGFPEDMQEREFQNMFTFSDGFEAATLKIPNKEYTAYGARGYQGFSGPNDPYNLVTVNQGGVVVDGGRDGTMSSWPTAPGDDSNPHFTSSNGNMAPRKQIIGFAKFKTRDAAIHARDTLQGRRVDIEKGAVLKAEMAKKNLHTKRGVGPVAGPALPTPAPGSNQQMQNHPHMNGINVGHLPDQFNLPNDPYRQEPIDIAPRPGAWRDQLQRDVHAVTNGINSTYSSDFHPRKDQEEELRRRDRESSIYSAMGFPTAVAQSQATRGPRERAEDEERRRKEKERLRANSSAFETFLPSMPAPPPLSRQNSGLNGFLPPPMDSGSGMGSSPLLANTFTAAPNINQQSAYSSQQQHDDLAVGPWDHVHASGISASRSSSQRSMSPDDGQDTRFSPPGDGRRTHSGSSTSSVRGSQGPGVIGSGSVSGDENDIDLQKVMSDLVLNTDNGTTSPQLPSPASGASSTSTRNAVDQNPPINTLYVGNLPTSPPPLGYSSDYLEESIRVLFSVQPGYKRMCFRTKANGPMCFVEFHDVASASRALNELYGNTLNGLVKHGGIRLSYSKNPLGVRTPTSATSPTTGSLQDQQQAMQSMAFQQDQFRADEVSQTTPTGILRREGNNGNYGNTFMTSPPPRFTSPPAGHIGQSSMPNPGNHFSHRTNGGSLSSLYSYNLAAASGLGGSSSPFAPFGISSPTIPEQSSSDDLPSLHSQHFHRTLSPPVGNIEATRAG